MLGRINFGSEIESKVVANEWMALRICPQRSPKTVTASGEPTKLLSQTKIA